MSGFYPRKINHRFQNPDNSGEPEEHDAMGAAVSFTCGVSVKVFLSIDSESKEITCAGFTTNGCGYVTAAADALVETIIGRKLVDLHGLDGLKSEVVLELGRFPEVRTECLSLGIEALQKAFAEYRNARLDEWDGEKMLVCTCFGISEQTIESAIRRSGASTVEQIGEACNAGTGCGSCQMLIAEILESVQ